MDIEAIRFIDKLNTLAKRTAKQLYVPWTKAKQRNHLTTINASLCYDDRADITDDKDRKCYPLIDSVVLEKGHAVIGTFCGNVYVYEVTENGSTYHFMRAKTANNNTTYYFRIENGEWHFED